MKKLSLVLIAGAMFAACNQAAKTETNAADSIRIADSLAKVAAAQVATTDSSSMAKDSSAAAPATEVKKEEGKK